MTYQTKIDLPEEERYEEGPSEDEGLESAVTFDPDGTLVVPHDYALPSDVTQVRRLPR